MGVVWVDFATGEVGGCNMTENEETASCLRFYGAVSTSET